jgi:hypothetical protein
MTSRKSRTEGEGEIHVDSNLLYILLLLKTQGDIGNL